jgi:threonine/homoserine efflux transporter RhtA
VVSDIDDTVKPGKDPNASGAVYPGARAFFAALDAGIDGTDALGDVHFVTARDGVVVRAGHALGRDVLPALTALLVLGAGGVLCGAVPTVLFYAGLLRIEASRASVLALMEPFVAVVFGVVVWGEALHRLGVVGGLSVLGGAALLARAPAVAAPGGRTYTARAPSQSER